MTTAAPAARKPLKKINDSTEFYQHQVDGVRWMATVHSFILADDMGLGKSLQVLTAAAVDFEGGYASRVCIVAPASLLDNWVDELMKHTSFTWMVLDGTPARRERMLEQFDREGIEVLILSYDLVKAHTDRLSQLAFDVVICDEAHAIKSPKAGRTKSIHKMYGNRWFLVTGSPLLNDVRDLWGLLHRVEPHEYPNFWKFQARYAVFGGYKKKQVVGIKNEAELIERLQRVMLRRTKDEVLDLPPKHWITVDVGMTKEQGELYREVVENLTLTRPSELDPEEIDNALTKFLRLKMICATTAAIDPLLGDHSEKLDRVVTDIKELYENGHKTVVFTQFLEVQAALQRRLAVAGIDAPYLINGAVDKRERIPIVKAWTADPAPGPIIVGLQVGGVGLNMVASRHVLFVDKLFVPKLNEQAEDRCHRIGMDETQPVQIRSYLCRGTVERRVEAILARKKKTFDTLIEGSYRMKKAIYTALLEAMAEEEEAA